MRLTETLWCTATAVAVATALAAAAPGAARPQLIHPGEFHQNEAPLVDGGGWVALVPRASGTTLERVTVRSVIVRDDLLDGDTGPFTGRRIDVPGLGSAEPAFMVRGVPRLVARARVTVATPSCDECPGTLDLATVRQVRFALGDRAWLLRVDAGDRTQPLTARSTVYLVHGERSQPIYTPSDVPDDPSWPVRWAGDLDGDGLLDLYVSLSHHYNVDRRVLFLSSAAKPGDLVGLVAEFSATGC